MPIRDVALLCLFVGENYIFENNFLSAIDGRPVSLRWAPEGDSASGVMFFENTAGTSNSCYRFHSTTVTQPGMGDLATPRTVSLTARLGVGSRQAIDSLERGRERRGKAAARGRRDMDHIDVEVDTVALCRARFRRAEVVPGIPQCRPCFTGYPLQR